MTFILKNLDCVTSCLFALLNHRDLSKSEMAEKNAAANGMKIASEAITNIRTVASLSE